MHVWLTTNWPAHPLLPPKPLLPVNTTPTAPMLHWEKQADVHGYTRIVIRTAVLRCEMMMFREVAVEKQIGAGRETECVNPPSRGFRGGFNVDKSRSYGDGVAWKRTIPADREHQSPRIQLIESLCQQIRRDLVSKPRCNSRFRQDSLTDQQDLGCGLIGLCFRPRTRPNMDESSRVLSVSVLYPAGARWLSLCGRSARIQASLRAYPGGFPWVEPVSCKVRTMCAKSRGIEFVRMLVALELYEIPREEVAGGAVGVVRGGFPREGAQRVRFPEEYPNADSCSPNRVIVSCQVRHSRVDARGHTQSIWDPHSVKFSTANVVRFLVTARHTNMPEGKDDGRDLGSSAAQGRGGGFARKGVVADLRAITTFAESATSGSWVVGHGAR
ncbi:hypothetical protein DFH09DRAFT_1070454 [Mycena vulgaris]|nr:hypothetical protein DFH09DRAFT_1070454 [Mycena vulgaris]